MSELNDLLDTAGDETKSLVKENLLGLIKDAKADVVGFASETGRKVEKWVAMCARREIDDHELEALLNARRRTARQFLNTVEIEARAHVESVTLGLIDLVLNKVLGLLL